MNLRRSGATALASLLLLLLAMTGLAAPARAQDGKLLPVTQAYRLSATVTPGQVHLHWDIAPHYYLYRSRIHVKSRDKAVAPGKLDLPPGTVEHDPYLGTLQIYHHHLDATLPFSGGTPGQSFDLAVTYQGCHEIEPKICFPPHTQVLHLTVPTAQAASGGGKSNGGGKALMPARGGSASSGNSGAAALPAAQAFHFNAIANGPHQLLLRWSMPKGYYLYRDKTELKLTGAGDAQLGTPQWPTGTAHHDTHVGDAIVYFGQVDVPVAVKNLASGTKALHLQARFQGCREHGICYPVMQRTVSIDMTGGALAGNASSRSPAAAGNKAVAPMPPPNGAASASLWAVLLAALGGGLLLNLMPCVLPVLSLKAVSVLESGAGAQVARRRSLAYTAGVLVSFAVVGGVVLALRAAGKAYGWGFQLQQPLFVAALVYVLLAMGLSFSGVVQFGARLAGTGQSLASRSGLAGDFFTGVLAVVVASPCTAPFMGSALAYAFAASPLAALLVFVMLGVGLALPFLLIAFYPALARWLPRPGAWMETLKQVLAFPLYLTAAWLAWVLTNQRGADAVGLLLVGAVILSMGLWWGERSRHRGAPSKALAGLLLLGSLVPLGMISQVPPPSTKAMSDSGSVAFTPQRLKALRQKGTPVFVDMSADWCVTCKANEHAVLDRPAFRKLLKRTGTVYMKGDWTNEDPAITAFLQTWHSPGVPVYVVFPRGGGPGHKLPTVLTAGIARAAVEKATR